MERSGRVCHPGTAHPHSGLSPLLRTIPGASLGIVEGRHRGTCRVPVVPGFPSRDLAGAPTVYPEPHLSALSRRRPVLAGASTGSRSGQRGDKGGLCEARGSMQQRRRRLGETQLSLCHGNTGELDECWQLSSPLMSSSVSAREVSPTSAQLESARNAFTLIPRRRSGVGNGLALEHAAGHP